MKPISNSLKMSKKSLNSQGDEKLHEQTNNRRAKLYNAEVVVYVQLNSSIQ